MDIENMKNIVVLKNIHSNIIEEAFIVLKDNVKVHKDEKIKNKNSSQYDNQNNKNNKQYVLKEAEMIINDYISKIEDNSIKGTMEKIKLQEKYKRLKYSNIFFIGFSILSVISFVIIR